MLTRYELKELAPSRHAEVLDRLLIGSGEGCDVLLDRGRPSPRHAEVYLESGTVWIRDMGSASGTFVNDTRIDGATRVEVGDRLRCAGYEFQLDRVRWWDTSYRDKSSTVVLDSVTQLLQTSISGRARAPRPAHAQLRLSSDAEPGRRVVLARDMPGDLREWKIGRDPSMDVVLDAPGVSDFHATIEHAGTRWKLIDKYSANGTFVNGRRCSVRYLSHGDQIAFGGFLCLIDLPDETTDVADRSAWSPQWTALIAFAATLVLAMCVLEWGL